MKKLGFLQKQLLGYSLLLTVTVMILIFWAHAYLINISQENAAITQEQLTASTLNQIDAYLDQLMLIATQVAHDSELISTMEFLDRASNPKNENYFHHNTNIEHLLSIHNELKDPVYRIEAFNLHGDYTCTDATEELLQQGTVYVSDMEDFLADAFIRDQRNNITMGPYLSLEYADPAHHNCVFMIMPIRSQDGSKICGYTAVYRTIDSLVNQLNMDKRTDIDVYLFSERNQTRGRQLYPRNRDFPDLSGGQYYETQLQSEYDWFVVLLQNQSSFLAPYHNLLIYLYLGGAALLLLLFLCVYLLVQHTNKPILELSRRVKAATLCSLPESSSLEQTSDEVRILERSVEHMLNRVKISVKLEQQAYLKALQAQMKPHFLYNCLCVISGISSDECETSTVPQICNHLASMLRYETSYQTDLVTLSEELDNVKDYLALMKARYEHLVSYDIQVDHTLLQLPLPRLILQPLVENCFSHGFKSVEPPWLLSLTAFRDGHQWSIRISDNGCGFHEEKRLELERQVEALLKDPGGYTNLKIGGMGLVSTIVRLRLTSSAPVSFSISDNTPTGTIITLRGEYHD